MTALLKLTLTQIVNWRRVLQFPLEFFATIRAFAIHMAQPSWAMMIVALFIVSALAVPSLLLSPRQATQLLAVYPGYDRLDEHYYLMGSKDAHGSPSPHDNQTVVVVIGGSTTRESMSYADELAQILTQATGQHIRVADYTSSGQRLDTSAALAAHALCSGAKIAILGISVARLATENTPDRSQVNFIKGFGLRTSPDTLRELGIGTPGTSLAARRLVATSLALIPQYVLYDQLRIASRGVRKRNRNWAYRHHYVGKDADSTSAKKRMHKAQDRHVATFLKADRYLALLKSLAAVSRGCGGTLVLFDTPINPALLSDPEFQPYAKAFDVYREAIARLSREEGLRYFSSNDGGLLQPEDFFDYGHLQTWRAINATTMLMANEIAKVAGTKVASRGAQ